MRTLDELVSEALTVRREAILKNQLLPEFKITEEERSLLKIQPLRWQAMMGLPNEFGGLKVTPSASIRTTVGGMMGYMRHHAIAITSWSEERIKAARSKAEELLPGLVSPIIEGRINSYYSFFVAPDGSKEGWDESDAGDAARTELKEFLLSYLCDGGSYVDWAELQYGDDERETKITDSSDDRCASVSGGEHP